MRAYRGLETMATQTAPGPEALIHLRPTDGHGSALVAFAVGSTALAVWLSSSGGWVRWAIGQTILAAALVQWFAVLHECGHRTMFRARRLNTLVGVVAGFLTMIPYRSWVRVHGRHHKWTGWQDLDPTGESLVPRRLSRLEHVLVNVCWRLWIPLFSTLYRIENYWNLRRLARMFPRADDHRPMQWSAILQLASYAILVAAAGPSLLARVAIAGVVLSLMVEDVLLLSQHGHVPQKNSEGHEVQPVPAVGQEVFTRSLRLPSWASTLLLHLDAHELHHMFPFVPGYHLRRIPYQPSHEIGWFEWIRASKRLHGVVLLFQNRHDTGAQI
jgi:omega-6 fatty acid desaturase (delta-12 desaturase)